MFQWITQKMWTRTLVILPVKERASVNFVFAALFAQTSVSALRTFQSLMKKWSTFWGLEITVTGS